MVCYYYYHYCTCLNMYTTKLEIKTIKKTHTKKPVVKKKRWNPACSSLVRHNASDSLRNNLIANETVYHIPHTLQWYELPQSDGQLWCNTPMLLKTQSHTECIFLPVTLDIIPQMVMILLSVVLSNRPRSSKVNNVTNLASLHQYKYATLL